MSNSKITNDQANYTVSSNPEDRDYNLTVDLTIYKNGTLDLTTPKGEGFRFLGSDIKKAKALIQLLSDAVEFASSKHAEVANEQM